METQKQKIKVLLVEDDTFLATMYRTKLVMENHEVVTAADGEEGLKAAQTVAPDVILLDIILPKMDGWQVLERLKEANETKNIPVILLTNLGQKDDIEKGLSLGAQDYLIKAHFTPSEVVKKIENVLKPII